MYDGLFQKKGTPITGSLDLETTGKKVLTLFSIALLGKTFGYIESLYFKLLANFPLIYLSSRQTPEIPEPPQFP